MGAADAQPLISVIVPIYKVEPYLRACVDSILAQTYTNLEIILVDDGSPDNCPAICDEYAKADPRVKVIHKANGGLSDARNAGLSQMTGEYLMFVDSDDCLMPDAVEVLLNHAVETGASLCIGAHMRFSDLSDPVCQPQRIDTECLSGRRIMENMLKTGCAAWARLYHHRIHDGIIFPPNEINEDEAIVLQILERCEYVVLTNRIVYRYRCRPESITTTSFSPKKFAWYRHCRDNLAWIRKHHPALTDAAAARYRGAILWTLTEIALADEDYTAERIALIAELKQNKEMFSKINFSFRSDRIRMWMLCSLPFAVYRTFIRIKRSRRTP